MKSLIIFLVVFLVISGFQLYKKKRVSADNKVDFLEIGKLIYQKHQKEFAIFFNLYQKNKKDFKEQEADLLEESGIENPTPLEATYLFGSGRELLGYIDWRGEENENEVEEYVQEQLAGQEINWTYTKAIRKTSIGKDQGDGIFIISLFKEVDKDLNLLNKKLLFFDLGFDAYAFAVVDKITFDQIIQKAPNSFHGSEKLKKK
ncbi:hypothetical protein ACMA1I_22550 [Pontibacter sp. 13R65]|uniref:DUF6630 family protein n=1 Tax=Pontibacter sp. 13R65 TaxID=3127458 RepID=UPI00301BB68E